MSRKRPKHTNSEKREEKEEVKNKKRAEKERFLKRIFGEDKKAITLVAAVFFVIGFVISAFFGFSGSPVTGMVVSKEDIGAKVVDYVNNNLIQPGTSVTMVSVEEENGLYKVITSYQGNEIPVYVTKDGILLLVGTVYDMTQELEPPPEEPPEQPQEPTTPEFPKSDEPENTNIKTFFDSGADICYEDGKPVIRMYASSGCGYCKWNKPMYEKVVKEYMDQGKIVAYLWEGGKNILSDEQEPQPQEELALYQEYGFGGVPAFIFGCKYYRGGASFSRVENGEELEEAELRNVIEDLLAA
ncbi:MAG: hypothetical protein KAU24_02310 [Candidatus Aenigmarchaeota archaeon]|nr:hypothetical protein [Candidatus Aenigmarchaeota archaeon]